MPKSVLREARRISKFAIGAYGLQSIIWGKGRRVHRAGQVVWCGCALARPQACGVGQGGWQGKSASNCKRVALLGCKLGSMACLHAGSVGFLTF